MCRQRRYNRKWYVPGSSFYRALKTDQNPFDCTLKIESELVIREKNVLEQIFTAILDYEKSHFKDYRM